MTDRSFRSFLRATWDRPGKWPRLLALLGFGIASALKGGIVLALLILGGTVLLGSAIAYPYYRRHGRLVVDRWHGL